MSFRRQRSPLIFPAISWISGLIVGKFLTIPVTLLFGLSIFLLFITKNRTIRIPAIFLLIAFLGTIRITTDKIYPDFHIYHITNKNPCIVQPIKAKICSEVRKLEDRYRFSLDLIEINEKKTSGRINFSTRQDSLQYGDIIETVAEIRKIRNTTNPSSFDYREYLSAKHIFASGYSKSFINIVGSKSNKYKQVMNSIRNFIRQRIVRRIGDHSGFIQAIAIGDKGDLGSEKNSVMKAGLSHLLAVSGLHVGIIALMFFALLKLLIPNRNISRIILIIILFIYGTVCEWSPSVSRAFIMISIYLLAKIRQSKPDANNILSAAMIITTFINPEQLFSVGFQLSYTA
ncbi:MAG: ComEC family competence protein, partial [Candidatus Cloacimonetes bacterium]|nr:ComEC family competence protein [Candidatus Cloacimonadota bacterium]